MEQTDSSAGRKLLYGAIAGAVATVPMTAVMEVLHHQLPQVERYPLPPSEIVSHFTDDLHLSDDLTRGEHTSLSLASHFAYGTAAGALYLPLMHNLAMPPALRGMAYGLGVWGASYLGLLPALGILKPATEHPPRRNALMIAAHLVWGAALGAVAEGLTALEQRRPSHHDGDGFVERETHGYAVGEREAGARAERTASD